MCRCYYLAADAPLPLVAWDESAPAVYVDELPVAAEAVKTHFTKRHVVYIGSREGCGCGFRCGEEWESGLAQAANEPTEIAEYQKDHEALGQYLKSVCATGARVELYSCWSDDEPLPMQAKERITAATIANESFNFKERTLYEVSNS